MGTVLVTYEPSLADQSFQQLSDEIKLLSDGKGWWHHLRATWLVNTDRTVVEVRERLRSHVPEETRLLVIDVSGAARSWAGFGEHSGSWLRDRW